MSTTGEKTNAGKILSCVYLLLDISPSSPNPNSGPPSFPPTPLVPPYKRGEDRGCFAFLAGGMTEDTSFLLHGRRGTGSLAPLLLPSPKLGRGAGGEGWRGRGAGDEGLSLS
ncbi:hypothetical protein MC7420_6080 [Coleofasciculus chthonoplastes PCC 7420]|uniref:Uncharacterized protein n=1 Tax=Coleofasciculus chthonoplastes PCC 7420 TaxID=118168 RepID=B4VU43_9CYAN|nr:hypothetical protein MC7420_6080 [Coleofasciculus chthonoplastes PCC 7420]